LLFLTFLPWACIIFQTISPEDVAKKKKNLARLAFRTIRDQSDDAGFGNITSKNK